MSNTDIFNNPAFDTMLSAIASAEAQADAAKGDASTARSVLNTAKIDAYVELIAGIAPLTLRSGKFLKKADREHLTAELTAMLGDDKKSVIKKYRENSVKARVKFGIHGDNITPDMVREIFADQEIDSEAKLAKAVKADKEKSKAEKLAEAVYGGFKLAVDEDGQTVQTDKFVEGLTDEEIEEFLDQCAVQKAAREAARVAATEAASAKADENDVVNSVFEAA